jgi:hypothetical protein
MTHDENQFIEPFPQLKKSAFGHPEVTRETRATLTTLTCLRKLHVQLGSHPSRVHHRRGTLSILANVLVLLDPGATERHPGSVAPSHSDRGSTISTWLYAANIFAANVAVKHIINVFIFVLFRLFLSAILLLWSVQRRAFLIKSVNLELRSSHKGRVTQYRLKGRATI